ncbi:MAG: murein biosynthesis integral membrane protein MurJ, partial [Minisyncoccia bacterium]
MPFLTHKLFPGFDTKALADTVLLSRIMLLSPMLLGISNLFATITQTFKKFFVYALAPIFYNVGIIVGILVLYPVFGITGLAYGVALGSLLHMLIQLPIVIRQGFLPRLQIAIKWSSLVEVLKHSLPRTLALSMPKIVFLIFVSLASTLAAGTISVFNLSYNLQSVPLAIIGVSYSLAAFPVLVEYFTNQEMDKFRSHVIGPIRQIIFWSLPIVALFIVLRAQIVRVILGTGNFDWSDTRLTAASLALFIISVVAQSIVMLLIRAYYAAGRTWKPLLLNIVSATATVLFAYLFVYIFNTYHHVQDFFEGLLRIKNVPGSSVIMLSLAYSVGMFLSLGLLWYSFKRDFNPDVKSFGITKTMVHSVSASLLLGAVSYVMLQITAHIFSKDTTLGVFGHGFFAGIIGIFVAGVYLLLLKNEE